MTSMSRLADVLHIGFAIRPEWNTSEPLRPCNIHVETIASRQTQQLVGWDGIVAKLRNIIQEELGTAHIMQFQTKLRQVSPGPGYQIDAETRQAISHNVRLASSQLPTIAPKTPTASRVVPFGSATPNTSTSTITKIHIFYKPHPHLTKSKSFPRKSRIRYSKSKILHIKYAYIHTTEEGKNRLPRRDFIVHGGEGRGPSGSYRLSLVML